MCDEVPEYDRLQYAAIAAASPESRPRPALTRKVSGWCSAKTRSTDGIDATGTKALDRNENGTP